MYILENRIDIRRIMKVNNLNKAQSLETCFIWLMNAKYRYGGIYKHTQIKYVKKEIHAYMPDGVKIICNINPYYHRVKFTFINYKKSFQLAKAIKISPLLLVPDLINNK